MALAFSESDTVWRRSCPAKQFATFSVGELLFGVDVRRVQEIIRSQELTPVPLSNPMIKGLMNLRGQIIPAIDMRRRLSIPGDRGERQPMNVVVWTEEGVVSLLVDRIGDVIEVDAADFERTPATLDVHYREVVEGVYKLKGELLLVLSPERAADTTATVEISGHERM